MAPDEQAPDSAEAAEQRRRLETLGRLAGNVVHDFNNLLMVIDGYGRMLLEEANLDAAARDSVAEILNAAGRASALTRQLLAFTRARASQTGPLDWNSQLIAMRPMLGRLLGDSIQLDYELAEGQVVSSANLGEVEQVLLNLIVNARDALPLGGRILVRTLCTGDEVRIEVRDDGVGIPPEIQSRIFEPYFTTKPEGKGTGIGLALVVETVREWGGDVTATSEPGEGATFVLRLPAITEHPLTGNVLVVEDEPAIRSLVKRVLEHRGLVVDEASDSDSAVAIATQASTLNLLITDLELPSGSGKSVAQAIRNLHPKVKIMYISGYTPDQPGEGEFALQKPFSTKALVLGVQHLLKFN